MSDTAATTTGASAPTWRIAPSVPVAIGVIVAYVVVFIGLSATSGIAYDVWFTNSSNIVRAAVIPLVGGCLVLILFLLWARWDFVFKDPERLPMSGGLRVVLVLYLLGIIAQFAVADWSKASDRLLPILAVGILVGFAEETLFRGIILRSLRTNARPEAWVMLISSLWFGFFHLTNLFNGVNAVSALIQCLLASAGGVVYYLFRRLRGLLILAMVAHGLWNTSLFLPAPSGGLGQRGPRGANCRRHQRAGRRDRHAATRPLARRDAHWGADGVDRWPSWPARHPLVEVPALLRHAALVRGGRLTERPRGTTRPRGCRCGPGSWSST